MTYQNQRPNDWDDGDNQEEVVVHIKIKQLNTKDFSGQQFNEWTILAIIDQQKNIYKVRCSCGKEWIREIYTIVNYKVNQCRVCYKKNSYFHLK